MGIASKTFNSLKQICVGSNNVKEVFVGSTKVWTRPGISVSLNDSSDIAITGGSRTITVSCTGDWIVSSAPSWLSVSKSGNTLTVTASTNAKNLDSRSADLTFTQIDTESTASVTIKQLADAHTTITYGVPEITFNNYSNIVASGATVSPSGSWTQTRVQNWESEATTTLSNATGTIDDGYTTYSGSATGATLNTATGVITWDNNTSTSARSITVTATVSVNGQTASKTATCTQEKGAKVYDDITITKFEYPRFTALSCTKTPTLEYTQPWTWNGVAGSGGNITNGLSASYAMSDTSETIWWWDSQNTGAITVTDNNSRLEKTITVTVTVSGNSKTATATHTATQDAGTVEYIITPSTTATGELGPTGSTTSTITYTTKWNGKVTSTGTALSGYTITENSDTKSCMTATGTSGTVTITANNQNLEGGSFSYTISKAGYTSATITGSVAKGYYTYSEITDLSCTYSTISAAGGSSSPSISYKQTYGWNGATSGIATITGGTNDDDYTTYSVVSGKDVTLNTTTGVVTWGVYNPTSGSQDTAGRSSTIKMIVSRNGKTASKEVIASQAGEVVTKTEYGDWAFSLTPSTTSIAAAGGTVTMTLSRPTRSVKYTYSSGDTKTVTETATAGTFALTRSNASFTLSGTSVTMNASTVPTFTISVGATGAAAVSAISTTVTAAFTATNPTTGTTTASVTSGSITRSAASFVQDHYRFSTFTLSKSSFTAAAGSATLSMGIQKRSEYTGSQYTSWADHNPGSGLTIFIGVSNSANGISSGTITYGVPSTSTLSVGANRLDNSTGGKERSTLVSATLTVGSTVVASSSTLTISQEADKISSYNKPVVTFQNYTDKDASAGTKGLTATPTFTQQINYVSGYTSSTSSGGTIVYSGSATGATVNTSTGVITWERNESETNSRSITVTATITANGQSGSDTATCTQTKDVVSYTYANPVVSLAYNTNAEPSKSATQSPTLSYTQMRTNSYVSGKPSTTTTLTSGASSITYAETTAHANASVNASSGVVTWDSANTSTSSTRSCGVTATVTAYGKTGTGSATATQRTDYVNSYSYSDVTVSLAYGTDAEPTINATQSPTVSYSQVRTNHYKSGNSTTTTLTTGGSISYSETTASSYASVNSSSGVVTWSAANTGDRRTVGITATVSMNSKSGSKAATAGQKADYITSTSYGNVTKGSITNATIPASGTTTNYTATAGNGSQVITYTWKSGKANTSETKTIAPNVASISATAGSKDVEVSGVTTVKSQLVTWAGSGSKSASDTMYIYQAANAVTKVEAVVHSATLSSNHWYYSIYTIGASGGTATCSGNGGCRFTFTSGSTAVKTSSGSHYGGTLSFSRTYSGSATGFTVNSDGSVTAENNKSTSARSISVSSTLTVSWGSLSNSLTQSATISQSAGAVVYGNYTGTLSLSKTSVGAGDDSLTVTYGKVYRPWTWNGVAGSGGDEYYSGTVYATVALTNDPSGHGNYCSISSNSHTNSSSSTDTATVSKTTYGTTSVSSQGYTVYLRLGSSSGSSIRTVTFSTNANNVTNDGKSNPSYGSWSYNWTTNDSSTRTRTVTYTRTYASGKTENYSGSNQTETGGTRYLVLSKENTTHTFTADGGTAFTATTQVCNYWGGTYISAENITGVSASCSGFTCSISGSTLTITASHLGTTATDEKSSTVVLSKTGFVTRTGYTTMKQVANKANASSAITTYGTPSITIGSGITAGGGSASISVSVTNVRQYYWTSGSAGSTASEAGSYANLKIHSQFFTTSSSATSGTAISRFTLSGTSLSHSSMAKNVGYDVVIVSATNSLSSSIVGYSGYSRTQNSVGSYYDSGEWSAWTNTGSAYDTGSEWEGATSDHWAECSIGSGISASGGQATVTADAGYTRNFYWTQNIKQTRSRTTRQDYTSGSYNTSSRSETQEVYYTTRFSRSSAVTGDYALIEFSDNNSRYTLSGHTLIHSTMGTDVTTDTCTVRCTNKNKTTVLKEATVSVTNSKSVSSYGDWKAVTNWSGWADYDTPYPDTQDTYVASVSIGDGMTAAGGSATVTHSGSHKNYKWKRQRKTGTQYRDVNYSYTSGSTSVGSNESSKSVEEFQKVLVSSSTVADTTKIEITSNGNSRFSLSGNTLTHTNMAKNTVTDTVVIKVTNKSATSVTNTTSKSITNSVGSWYDNGSWSSWIDSGSPYETGSEWEGSSTAYWASISIGSGITAAGGSATITASAGHTRNFYKTRNIATYRTMPTRRDYTSGSYDTSSRSETSSRAYDSVWKREAAASDEVALSKTVDNNNRFTLSGTTLNHSTMGKNVTTDNCTIRCTNRSSPTVTKDASVSVSNAFVRSNRLTTPNTTSVTGAANTVTLTCAATDQYTSGTYNATMTLACSSFCTLSKTSVTGTSLVTLTIPANPNSSQRVCKVWYDGDSLNNISATITQGGGSSGVKIKFVEEAVHVSTELILDDSETVYDGMTFEISDSGSFDLTFVNYNDYLSFEAGITEMHYDMLYGADSMNMTFTASDIKRYCTQDSDGYYILHYFFYEY